MDPLRTVGDRLPHGSYLQYRKGNHVPLQVLEPFVPELGKMLLTPDSLKLAREFLRHHGISASPRTAPPPTQEIAPPIFRNSFAFPQSEQDSLPSPASETDSDQGRPLSPGGGSQGDPGPSRNYSRSVSPLSHHPRESSRELLPSARDVTPSLSSEEDGGMYPWPLYKPNSCSIVR